MPVLPSYFLESLRIACDKISELGDVRRKAEQVGLPQAPALPNKARPFLSLPESWGNLVAELTLQK